MGGVADPRRIGNAADRGGVEIDVGYLQLQEHQLGGGRSVACGKNPRALHQRPRGLQKRDKPLVDVPVRWRGDSSHGVVDVAKVVEAIDRGDIVQMWFTGELSGDRVIKKLLPNGKVTIAEATVIPGRTLFHLPRV